MVTSAQKPTNVCNASECAEAEGDPEALSEVDSNIAALHRPNDADIAFEWLRDNINIAKYRVLHYKRSTEDPSLRSLLIELLGESRDEQFITTLARELRYGHPRVRFWAWYALTLIGTKQARRVADEALRQAIARRRETCGSTSGVNRKC